MLDSFSISTDCILCLTDREAVYKKLKHRLTSYHRSQTKKRDGYIDRQVYENTVLEIVKGVLQKTDPYMVNLVEARVAWEVTDDIDTSIHVQMSSTIRALMKTNPAIAELHH